VTGFVRNLPDGRVEMTVEGEEAELDNLLNDLQEQMEGKIKRVDLNSAPATGEFKAFEVRH
jgi:acylphosphatase